MWGSDDGAICFSLCGGRVCCFMIVMTLSAIGGCGGGDGAEREKIRQRKAELKEHGGTCYGEFVTTVHEERRRGGRYGGVNTGLQNTDCVCPLNNTCTWSHDGVCDEASGVCAEGTDCEDCGTCNWYRCVSKAEVPKPTTLDKCENWTQAPLITRSPTPSPPCTMHGNEQVCR